MTDWSRRTIEVPTALPRGGSVGGDVWVDGPNADKMGTDYRRTTAAVTGGQPLRLELAPGGGAALRLRRKE